MTEPTHATTIEIGLAGEATASGDGPVFVERADGSLVQIPTEPPAEDTQTIGNAWDCSPDDLSGALLRYCVMFWRNGEDLDEMEKFVAKAAAQLMQLRAALCHIEEATMFREVEPSDDPHIMALNRIAVLARRDLS